MDYYDEQRRCWVVQTQGRTIYISDVVLAAQGHRRDAWEAAIRAVLEASSPPKKEDGQATV